MAATIIEKAIENAIANGAEFAENNSFVDKSGNKAMVRQFASESDPLVPEDIIVIPSDYKVIRVRFNPNDDNKFSCIMTTVIGAGGIERPYRFFPNSLVKSVVPVDDLGNLQARVRTSGTAVDLFRSCQSGLLDDAVKLLAGKKIKVTEIKAYTVIDYRTGQKKQKHIAVYDIVN